MADKYGERTTSLGGFERASLVSGLISLILKDLKFT